MSANAIEIAVFIAAFITVWGIYELGGGEEHSARSRYAKLHMIDRYSPSIRVLLDLRNDRGAVRQMRVRITGSFYYPDGRLCLSGFCGPLGLHARTLPVDQIVSIATPYGVVVDTQRFLVEKLNIPAHLLPAEPIAPMHHLAPAV